MNRDSHDELTYWVDTIDARVARRLALQTPPWCVYAQPLVAYGEELKRWVAQKITPQTIEYAQGLLDKAYRQIYHSVPDEHRIDERHATHPCLHRASMDMWQQLDRMMLRGRIDDFVPASLRIAPVPEHRVIEADPEPFDELPAILDGFGDTG
jgi:hypothetical protein